MSDKNIEDLKKEIANLNAIIKKNGNDFETLKTEAEKINGDLKLKNEELSSDNELLKEEISELKKNGKSKKEEPKKEQTPKEKGFTTVMDVKKMRDEAEKNAAKK